MENVSNRPKMRDSDNRPSVNGEGWGTRPVVSCRAGGAGINHNSSRQRSLDSKQVEPMRRTREAQLGSKKWKAKTLIASDE